MKIIKQLKKASMSNNKKAKKNLAKKIDKKILKALKQRFLKAKKEMKEAKDAYNIAKEFFEKNKSKKKTKSDNSKPAPKTKKVAAAKKPESNARVTTLSQLEPTTPKKTIKRLPKPLRIKKSKAPSKKRKTTLPKKVAVKKTVLKVVESTPEKATPTPKPVAKKPATKPTPKKVTPRRKPVAKPVAKKTTPTAKTTVKKSTPRKVTSTPKSTPKPVAKKTPATRKPTITKAQMENLKIVEGIGPAIEKILKSKGIKTVADLSKTRIGVLRNILEEAGSRFRIHKPDTWARQARMAAAGKFAELKEWQKELNGGKK